MQWTPEMDALLNQCVFECGYDFTAAAQLLLSRARQLRLIRCDAPRKMEPITKADWCCCMGDDDSADERIMVSSDECQVQWMAINPVMEDDEDGEMHHLEELLDDHDDLYLRRSLTHQGDDEMRDVSGSMDGLLLAKEQDEAVRPVELTKDEPLSRPAASTVDVPDGCPKLELSLSDADLDALLSSLPTKNDGATDSVIADSKHVHDASSSSEMQWVLSFLTNPDEIAHHDAEAKNMLFDVIDRSEDDNFQYFLQELNHANLLSPQKPDNAQAFTMPSARRGAARDGVNDNAELSEEEDASDDDDWTQVRKTIKASRPTPNSSVSAQKTLVASHKRRLTPRPSHTDEVLPPAAPVRFPPRGELTTFHHANSIEAREDNRDGDLVNNGLDALPRYTPPATSSFPRAAIPRESILSVSTSSSRLFALSQEIGDQMRSTGEFQFPKRLFRASDNEASVEVELEQVPEDEP